jgi:CheY-like chemotaxis protein
MQRGLYILKPRSLDGVKVLVLEDSYLIAELIEDMLLQAGAIVVGTTKSVAMALNVLATQAVDLACLDIDLGDENSFPVADELASRGIPFVFVTASAAGLLPQRHNNRILVPKMQMTDELVAACCRLPLPPTRISLPWPLL